MVSIRMPQFRTDMSAIDAGIFLNTVVNCRQQVDALMESLAARRFCEKIAIGILQRFITGPASNEDRNSFESLADPCPPI